MKVLVCHNYYRSTAPSGEDVAYNSEKLMLLEGGLELETFEKFNDDLKNINTIQKIKLGISNSWSNESYYELKGKLNKFKPDIVHFHNTFPQITPSAYAACAELNVPVVQTLHNFRLLCANALLIRNGAACELCLSGSMWPALKYRCYRNSVTATASQVLCVIRNRYNGSYFNNVNKYIALTRFAKSKFEMAGFPSELITIRSNFLSESLEYSREYNNYAVFVGRVTKEKGLLTLLKAWKKNINFQLKVVGGGELLEKYKQFAKENNIDVIFLGHLSREETHSIIGKARFMILPSECYEGFPISLLEAFASGTPVIVSNIGGQSEIVENDKLGKNFKVGDIDDLAKKCKELIEQDGLVDSLRKNARLEFEKKYTKKVIFRETLEIYNSVIN